MKVIKDGKAIIVGRRNATNGLWNVPLALKGPLPAQLASPPRNFANGAIQHIGTKQDTASYLHPCSYSPKPSTFLCAVQRGHYTSWLGLTPSLVTKHLAKALATSKGHLRMQQQNL